MIKITIEDSSGIVVPEGEKIELTCEHITFKQERGMRSTESFGAFSHEPNGQERLEIKGWSGCENYGDFVAQERPEEFIKNLQSNGL